MLRALLKPKIWLILSGAILLSSCAQIVPPSGGPKDTKAPEIVSQNFKDSSIRFSLNELEFRFDEVITAENAKRIIEFSPFANEDVDVRIVGKKIEVKVPAGTLDPNTTYSMSLVGVKDVTEGNALAPKSYIFSTGDYIDSLTLIGTVLRSEDSRPDTSVAVMLYPAEDSIEIVKASKPKYYAPVRSDGNFTISALPPGRYRIYALDDQNRNFRFDLPTERFGFDTTVYEIRTGKSNSIRMHTWIDIQETSENSSGGGNSLATRGGSGGGGGTSLAPGTSGFTFDIDTASAEPTQELLKPLVLKSGLKIDSFDVGLMSLTDTTSKETLTVEANLDSTKKNLNITPVTGWYSSHGYRFFLREGAVKDSTGEAIKTTSFYFTTVNKEDYGSVLIHFKPVDSTLQYVAELSFGNEKRKFILNDSLGFDISIPELLETEISVTYFDDVNRNGSYDKGNFEKRLQPEVKFIYGENFKVKKGWDHIYTLETLNQNDTNKTGDINLRGG